MTQLSNDGTNKVRSYTEVVTSVATPSVEITFDYVYGTDGVLVTIDGVDPTTLGITATMSNKTTVAFSPHVGSGHTIKLQRVTNIDLISYAFTSGALFIASNMDANFAQVLKSQQDVLDAFSVVNTTFETVAALATLANKTATQASEDVSALQTALEPVIVNGVVEVYSKPEVDALIATGGIDTVIPVAAGGTGATTAAEARANLGVPSTSDINAQISGKMDKAANLNDLQYKAAARTNLDVYNKGDVDNATAQATETARGTAKIATTTQAKELTDDATFLTPLKSVSAIRASLNVGDSAPIYACRAWVNFNARPLAGTYVQSGTNTVTVTMPAHGMSVGQLVNLSVSSGTGVSGSYVVTSVPSIDTFTYTAATILTTSGSITRNLFINASVNILGITDDGTGLYTITFIYDMPKTGYAVIGNATQGTAASAVYSADIVAMRTSAPGVLYNKTVSSFSIAVVDNNNDAVNDGNEIGIGVFA